MKYADGPGTEVEAPIAAPPARVWSFVSDINVPASFSREFRRAEWIDDGPRLGATFRGFNRHDAVGEWNVVCTVTACESDQTFEWTVGDVENRSARWRFDLEPDGHGTRLRFSAEMGPGPSGLTPAIARMPEREDDIVARRLAEWTDSMQRTVAGIAALAEAEPEVGRGGAGDVGPGAAPS
ncbi:MAG: SRPBCC family protein [Actinomycetota bacterium]